MSHQERTVLAQVMLLLSLVASPTPTRAQIARLLLEQGHQAYELADFERAASLLQAGLNPNAGPRDSLWVGGVQKLAYVLIELQAEPLAATWLRWSIRQVPDLPVDSVNFPPSVVSAIRAAKDFVQANPLPSAGVLSWRWPAAPVTAQTGALLLEQSNVPALWRLENGAALASGVPQQFPAGSYTILAAAEGYLTARGTVEVLPGVTTVLQFNLEPAARGFLYIASRPWGVVLVDGRRIGYTTVAAYPIPAGTHRVRVERPGYTAFDTTVTVAQRDQRLRLGTIQLQRERP